MLFSQGVGVLHLPILVDDQNRSGQAGQNLLNHVRWLQKFFGHNDPPWLPVFGPAVSDEVIVQSSLQACTETGTSRRKYPPDTGSRADAQIGHRGLPPCKLVHRLRWVLSARLGRTGLSPLSSLIGVQVRSTTVESVLPSTAQQHKQVPYPFASVSKKLTQ